MQSYSDSDIQFQKTPDYGIDAPEVLGKLVVIGVGLGIAGVLLFLLFFFLLPTPPALAIVCLNLGLWPCFWLLLTVGIMLWGSKVGKFRERDRLLGSIAWRGDEQVLDVGCGHGLMLIGAAKRMTTGKAIGIDLWQQQDQAGNSRQATWANAMLEGVLDRVEIK